MKHLIIAAAVFWALFQVTGMFWSAKGALPSGGFARLSEGPQLFINNPYHNGYFYLFGLTAAAPLDPAKAGYEIWVEEFSGSHHAGNVENRPSRSELSFTISPEFSSPSWESDEPLTEFRKQQASLRAATGEHQILIARYERWLGMPFEDWGFSHRVTPRYQAIMAVHRLYISEGFSLGITEGLDRLNREFQFWRVVLREAKTIDTKMFSQILISDDLSLLSRILAKPTVDKAFLTMGLQLTLPLSGSEHSLRWPIRNQLALAVKEGRAGRIMKDSRSEQAKADEEWLLTSANLPLQAFDRIEHPPARTWFGLTLQSAQAWETYAAYYDALISASENGAKRLPAMHEVTGTLQRGMIENLLNPYPVAPDWETFHRKLMETDTRLRLASLQIQLRRPSAQTAVPTRLAQVGSQYFDPFSGLPMLWSPTQQKLYSVGKDRLDDGGDPTFDISVPAIVVATQTAPKEMGQSFRSPRSTRQ
ncbi:MAG TPA: hypothetical protein VLD60_08015 [Nitrospira sp.]|nr:hypothetical protein [Nitrospira sp.]